MFKVLRKLCKEWKATWPSLVLQFVLFSLITGFIGYFVTEELTPSTSISVDCQIRETIGNSYTLDVSFKNKADFAGDDLFIYLWGVTSDNWESVYSASEQCERIKESELDLKHRFKIFCDFIPPESRFGFSIHSLSNKEIISTNSVQVEWWGKTTPYKKEVIVCE